MIPKLRVLVITLLLVVPTDQLSKLAAERWLAYGERLSVIDGFLYLTHARNPAAAFGLFSSVPADSRLIGFVIISLVALLVIASFYQRLAPGDHVQALGLSLVLAGASGNLIDRIWRGEVVDFLHVRLWVGYPWPDFNIADACIIVGVAALIADLLSREATARV